MLYTSGKRVGAARGLEYLQNTPKYTTVNDLGQTVVNNATLVNDDGTAHVAYEGAPGTYVGNLIEKQKKGFPLTGAERRAIAAYWAKNPTAGLATLDQLGGNHDGGITTPYGTAPGLKAEDYAKNAGNRKKVSIGNINGHWMKV